MKNILQKINAVVVVFLLFISSASLATGCLISNGTTAPRVITICDVLDDNDNLVIKASIGTLDVDPSEWEVGIVSAGVSDVNNANSKLFVNQSGDIVVVWKYVDGFGNVQIAASVLFDDTTDWHSVNVSQNMGSAYDDYTCSIDENGNALIVWTAYNAFLNTNSVLGVTANLGVSTDWSAPFVIVNEI